MALFPSLPLYRSSGSGRYVLGEGERIIDWEYTAEFRPEASQTDNRRFLMRFLGEYQQDRWVLTTLDAVYFSHEIELSGMLPTGEGLLYSAQARGDLKGKFHRVRPGGPAVHHPGDGSGRDRYRPV